MANGPKTTKTRRQFLGTGVGATLGAAALLQACTTVVTGPPPAGAGGAGSGPDGCATTASAADAVAALAPDAAAGAANPVATDAAVDLMAPDALPGSALDIAGAKMPFRQDDPAWSQDLMWDRDLVIQADHELNGATLTAAKSLLRQFDDGNTIGNEGCLLTCLAMVLRLMAPAAKPAWTPKILNKTAQESYYYTLCGLSMTTLYADLVSEVTGGAVQLCLKEEYLPGEPKWPRVHPQTSALVRAYRGLPSTIRSNFLVVLKTGTYDDTVASHYVVLHPDSADGPDQADAEILDPAKPLDETKVPWRLSDCAKVITGDPDIAQGWQEAGIEPTQIGGAWVFVRWQVAQGRALLAPLVQAWAAELAKLA